MNSTAYQTFNLKKSAKEISDLLSDADAIVVGIGAGLTAAANIGYSGSRFEQHFGDFIEKYRLLDMLQASLFDYPNWQTYWAFHSRFIKLNCFDLPKSSIFSKLKDILETKNYFIITTNSDNSLLVNGFNENKIFYIQGKYDLLQCSQMCSNKLYQRNELIEKMVLNQKNMQVSLELLPKCPNCDAFLEVNKRIAFKGMVENDDFFLQKQKYESFLQENQDKKVVFFEIGVGYTTPQLIKWPFWQMTINNPKAKYLVLNSKNYHLQENVKKQSKIFNEDIAKLIEQIWELER